ncbi:MAG: [acyl-carrier-protein] S-malonyltransferase [Candidatus Abyssobacteria bacterium SURF_5]|uniref:Malonyl CoA-acyl carrier protein transacylase n=1 Tax=Abyssobacteria bacterium (strain SURF_5) TaxID=2093360 RepID=A0A3A4NK48_ABYX5|nr:MAG: [acyl-carrier-protein] S-malonyltransferase [Candidatus Abyssubacteria bacterium SURF_5]
MGKIAWIFPGQGSQYVGMGKSLCTTYPEACRVLEQAEHVLGSDLREVMFEGPEETLRQTRYAQPAIFALSVAVSKVLFSMGLRPDIVAGHSLGEYSALVAGGAIDFEDAVGLVYSRATCMQYACEQKTGTMCAILGLDDKMVEEVCRRIDGGIVDVANFNSAEQVVISGEPEAVRLAGEEAKKRGAKRAVALSVSGAFHSRLMRPAAERFEQSISSARISAPAAAFYPNVSAAVTVDAEQIRENLLRQICSPVRWQHSITNMLKEGADTFIEVGPGKVLSGLLKRVNGSAVCLNAETPESLEQVYKHFHGATR